MKIETTRFGTITIEENKIIDMPRGMLGFPDIKKFVIIQHNENSPFYWFQSVDEPGLAFVITNPLHFIPDYDVDLESMVKEASWEADLEDGDLELYVVVNIPRGAPQEMTGNLIGPILINNKLNEAAQVVIADSPYSHRIPLLSKKAG